MMTAELLEERDIALQLHKVLSDIDPARWRDEMATALKAKLTELHARLERREHHAELATTIRSELPALDAPDKSRWLAFKQRVQPAYMALAARLRESSVHVPSLRPTNYARNVFHIGSALVAVLVIELVGNPLIILGIALAWAGFAWTCEISRRLSPKVNEKLMRFFSPVAHPHETFRVNSATWYATALVLLALTQSTVLCIAGVAVLGIGDPMAALIGKRFGRIKLLHGRSLEGTLAFVVSATAVTALLFSAFHPALGLGGALLFAACASVVGAVAELVSLRLDDNFSIPVSAAAGVALAAWVTQLPLM